MFLCCRPGAYGAVFTGADRATGAQVHFVSKYTFCFSLYIFFIVIHFVSHCTALSFTATGAQCAMKIMKSGVGNLRGGIFAQESVPETKRLIREV
jgi:hypothetical protein